MDNTAHMTGEADHGNAKDAASETRTVGERTVTRMASCSTKNHTEPQESREKLKGYRQYLKDGVGIPKRTERAHRQKLKVNSSGNHENSDYKTYLREEEVLIPQRVKKRRFDKELTDSLLNQEDVPAEVYLQSLEDIQDSEDDGHGDHQLQSLQENDDMGEENELLSDDESLEDIPESEDGHGDHQLQSLQENDDMGEENEQLSDDEIQDEDYLDAQEEVDSGSSQDSQSEEDYDGHPEIESHSEDEIDQDDDPLIKGTAMTQSQLSHFILAFTIRHGLSKTALQDLIDIFNLLIPGCLPKTKYFFDKLFFKSQNIDVHFFCPACMCYIGFEEVFPLPCPECHQFTTLKECKNSSSFFVVLPMRDQISAILSDENLQKKIMHGIQNREGEMYSVGRTANVCQDADSITLQFFADGAPVFSSSAVSVWPLMCTINELPHADRQEHVILHTLWFSKKKPRMDTFLKPFIDQTQQLSTQAINWTDMHGVVHSSKVFAAICVCDAVARAMLQNFKQFNGRHGCGYCTHPGDVVPKGRGHARVYPITPANTFDERTHQETMQHVETVLDSTEDSVCGVKGPSPLILLPGFDIVKGVPPEYMHSVCLGVTKQMTGLWCDGQNAAEEFHIPEAAQKSIDDELIDLKTPDEIGRVPRKLSDRLHWKACEWRAWLLFLSPVLLKGVLPTRLWKHWMLFVCSIHLLLQNSVSIEDINTAKLWLVSFVQQVPRLYGVVHVSYNVHILIHLPGAVQNWGPLCGFSSFMFEDAIGRLFHLFNGTRAVPMQIAQRFLIMKKLNLWVKSCNEDVSSTWKNLTGKCTKTKCSYHLTEKIIILSKASYRSLTDQEQHVYGPTQNYFSDISRCIINNLLYTTLIYSTDFKRCNSYFSTNTGEKGAIHSMIIDINDDGQQDLIIFYYSLVPAVLQLDNFSNHVDTTDFFLSFHERRQLRMCKATDVKNKCVFISSRDNVKYVVNLLPII